MSFLFRQETKPVVLGMLVALTYLLPAEAQEIKPEQLYRLAIDSVMTLRVVKNDNSIALGTAFLAIKSGLAVTAWHLIKDAKIVVGKFSDHEEFEVSGLIDKDERRDIALIHVKILGRPLLSLVENDPDVGAKAYVVGSPKGLEFTISEGLVNQLQTVDSIKQYQFSCAASPGNSGGPLLNAKGQVLGVVSWQVKDEQNLNFAIPAIYVLGLDATLPTQPWDKVQSTWASALFDTQPNPELDKLFGEGTVAIYDCGTAVNYAYEVMRKPDGFKRGVPNELYVCQREASRLIKELSRRPTNDPDRKKICEQMSQQMETILENVDLKIQAVKAAQATGGWDAQANDLLSRSNSIKGDQDLLKSPSFAKVKDTDDFKSSVPKGLYKQLFYDIFKLGIWTFSRQDLWLTVVSDNGLAYSLGFRSGDLISEAEGKKVQSMRDLKEIMYSFRGKRLNVTVLRDGKAIQMQLKIPEQLSAPQ